MRCCPGASSELSLAPRANLALMEQGTWFSGLSLPEIWPGAWGLALKELT